MNANTTQTESTSGVIAGVLKSSMQMGLGVTERVHQFAVEVPLSMVPSFIASKEQTTALKDKHRNLLRGVYGSIDSFATSMLKAAEEQVDLAADEVSELVETVEAELTDDK